MDRISLIDDTFLRLETRRQPFHIGMLMLFDPGEKAPQDFVMKLSEKLRKSTEMQEPFNRHLVQKNGLHYWEEDTDFDLEHHFAHIALPKPGRIRELLATVSRIHGGHLDRAYPLWRIYLIEGIEDGRFAVYMKIHHSLVDGIAGIKMLISSMSSNKRESTKLPPFWENGISNSKAQHLPVPTPTAKGLSAISKLSKNGLRSIPPVYREIRSNIADIWKGNPDFVFGGQAPRCSLNQSVSATRRFAAQSYSTPRMRAVGKAFDASINDVALAMCGAALRQYLADLDDLPLQPLVAAVPVSVRREDSTSAGNEVAFTLCHLATHLKDPAERIVAIKACMDYNKKHIRNLSPTQTLTTAAVKLIPGAINAIFNVNPNKTLGNLVISHVPGPKEDLYWQGAKLSGLYPLSLLTDGAALNITLISRHDTVDFGLIACRKSVPHVQRILKYLEDGLVELEEAVKNRNAP
ncbi:WS/DGAT/MGAT family O-acyltransferase [Zhongshania aquimaris]|uniref:diacylglycerol O-acyltransferase n=1 Tax=Zhongshania aquimaris TaxID=2857107 RepID=A0ABS6VW18_9GAMM|nr:wax ester/triacylglycerol synthase family O-acyltransferase [Zhongshania aquimaris]MBW2942517.1 wax ester/triacylglycerol synthase family O-acyltransferase [Zhongshania aquimaris]